MCLKIPFKGNRLFTRPRLLDPLKNSIKDLKDLKDPLLHSERTQGFAADPDYYWKGEVFACVGLPQNLKDLKDF